MAKKEKLNVYIQFQATQFSSSTKHIRRLIADVENTSPRYDELIKCVENLKNSDSYYAANLKLIDNNLGQTKFVLDYTESKAAKIFINVFRDLGAQFYKNKPFLIRDISAPHNKEKLGLLEVKQWSGMFNSDFLPKNLSWEEREKFNIDHPSKGPNK